MRRFFLRLLTVFRSNRADAELTREISSHLQLLEDQFVAVGCLSTRRALPHGAPSQARWSR